MQTAIWTSNARRTSPKTSWRPSTLWRSSGACMPSQPAMASARMQTLSTLCWAAPTIREGETSSPQSCFSSVWQQQDVAPCESLTCTYVIFWDAMCLHAVYNAAYALTICAVDAFSRDLLLLVLHQHINIYLTGSEHECTNGQIDVPVQGDCLGRLSHIQRCGVHTQVSGAGAMLRAGVPLQEVPRSGGGSPAGGAERAEHGLHGLRPSPALWRCVSPDGFL